MEGRADGEEPQFEEVLAHVVDGLQLVHDALDRAVQRATVEGQVEPGLADQIEGLAGQARVAADLGKGLVRRTAEVSEELRQYEAGDEFDEEVAYNAVLGYLRENIGSPFTVQDLRVYLDEMGVVYPEKVAEFNRLFRAWQEDARLELTTAEQMVVWAPLPARRGQLREYALAHVWRPPRSQPAPEVVPEPPIEEDPAETGLTESTEEVAASSEEGRSHLSPEAQLALNIHGMNPVVKATVLYGKLSDAVSGLEDHQARAAYNELLAKGLLHKRRKGGSLYFTTEPPEAKPEAPKAAVGSSERGRELDEAQKRLAKDVLSALSSMTAQQRQFFSVRQITSQLRNIRELKLTDEIGETDVNVVCRALRRQGILRSVMSSARHGQKLKFGFATKQVRLACQEDPGRFSDLVDSGELYIFDN